MSVHGFMYSILQHIPPKQFRLVRYYGAYSRKKIKMVKRFVRHSTITQKMLYDFGNKRGFCCSECGEAMEVVWYCRKPPPEDMSKIVNWLESQ
jgi:hypothetical protein